MLARACRRGTRPPLLALARHLSIPPHVTIGEIAPSLRKFSDDELANRFQVDISSSVADAARHITKHRLTFACVSDKAQGGRVVGMMTERDFVKYAVRVDASAFFSGRDATMEPLSRVMTPYERMAFLTPETTVQQALGMIQHKIWRHLPLLDAADRLQTMVDIRDLLLVADGGRSDQPAGEGLRSIWHGKSVWDLLGTKRREKIVQGTSLELYLRTRAARHTIPATAPIEAACQQMARERLTFLIVLDEVSAGAPKGRLVAPSPLERNRVIGLVNERGVMEYGANVDPGLTSIGTTPVTSIMTPLCDVVSVSLTDSVSKCVDLLFARNMRHVPVIDSEHLFGVISLRDVLRPMLEGPEGQADRGEGDGGGTSLQGGAMRSMTRGI